MTENTPDLFDCPAEPLLLPYTAAFEAWLREARNARGIGRDTSISVYHAMWTSLSKWAVGQTPPRALLSLTPADLELFLGKPARHAGGGDELSPRYVWRLLQLVDRVLHHEARRRGQAPNLAAQQLLQSREEWQHANAAENNPLPEHLSASQARDLVRYLSAVVPRAGRLASPEPTWQDLRNRCVVAVMLGSGVTPGEVRSLTLASVGVNGGARQGLPWKLVIGSHTATPEHETPLAAWAAHVLVHWLSTRSALGIAGPQLFPSTRTGKPLGKVAQYEGVRQVLQACGLEPAQVSGGSFRLRHTFALRQLRRGRDPAEVARWLGVDVAEMDRYQRVVFAPVADRL